ncbi:hypothetical protein HMPREF3187_01274 [Aerococcus christensenii]|uniref:Uncharacterized protein n=1 Tax=Aerococcus christensenii TaxID=87541 RepID=A0A133XU95_9LACT|nr:hypothetical protein HMPREF3187_01274 [Aerococcus christensenii]
MSFCPGSPPHTREKAFITVPKTFIIRITPAYAGKSNYRSNYIEE